MSESVKEKTTKNRPKYDNSLPTPVRRAMDYSCNCESWFEGFEKQEEEKQNITITQILEKINEIKDIDIQSKTKENGAFIFGFMKGYLHRGKEILG